MDDTNLNIISNEETECEYCKKKLYNIYSLKRHLLKCKKKIENSGKQHIDENKKLKKTIQKLEDKNKELLVENEVRKSKIDFMNIELEKFKKELKEKRVEIERMKERMDKLIDKLSISNVSNIVNIYNGEQQISTVVQPSTNYSMTIESDIINERMSQNLLIDREVNRGIIVEEVKKSSDKPKTFIQNQLIKNKEIELS